MRTAAEVARIVKNLKMKSTVFFCLLSCTKAKALLKSLRMRRKRERAGGRNSSRRKVPLSPRRELRDKGDEDCRQGLHRGRIPISKRLRRA